MPTPLPAKPSDGQLDFAGAIRAVLDGRTVTKQEWDDPETYIHLSGGHLRLHKRAGTNHDLIVSVGDMRGEDWVIRREEKG